MRVIFEGEPKEIAALVVATQERQVEIKNFVPIEVLKEFACRSPKSDQH